MGVRTGTPGRSRLHKTGTASTPDRRQCPTRKNHATGLRRSGAKIRKQTGALVALTVRIENRSTEIERWHRTRDGGKQK
jgi:hypothetical protein